MSPATSAELPTATIARPPATSCGRAGATNGFAPGIPGGAANGFAPANGFPAGGPEAANGLAGGFDAGACGTGGRCDGGGRTDGGGGFDAGGAMPCIVPPIAGGGP